MMLRRAVAAITVCAAVSLQAAQRPVAIDISSARTLATFDPQVAFGATIDAHRRGEATRIFTPANIAAMRSAGFQPLSYRLMTELAGETWHWNPEGSWSDPLRAEGYWTSSATASKPIERSWGYRLPRRGNTRDQATQSDYSRIDDGDLTTFWKSNPYLDEHFAGDAHPQWVLADLGMDREVDTVRIVWGEPYASTFRIQYWRGEDPIDVPDDGEWVDFPDGVVQNAQGGTTALRVSADSKIVRWVRISMSASSHTSDRHSPDIRDTLGYAICELSIGRTRGKTFDDYVRHGRSQSAQTIIWVSSTDPWHRASDRDESVEQLGFDALFRTGLTNGLGLLTPVVLLYGTPDDAAAEVSYLRSRGYPMAGIEMGEEPDGQVVSPEDYATLYRQFARAIHLIDPNLRLGGPAFQSTIDTVAFWPLERTPAGTPEMARTSWIGRFIAELRAHGRLDDFNFFSFEWYPFDDLCSDPQQQIEDAHALLRPVLDRWRREGVPESIPWIASEYGYSSFAGEAEVDLYAALVNTDFVAQFLSLGGGAAYFYGYEPDVLQRNERCPNWGNLVLFVSDKEHDIRFSVPTWQAARLLTSEWCLKSGAHEMNGVTIVPSTSAVTAYALRRPDGTRSMLLINSGRNSERVNLTLDRKPIRGLHMRQYSPAQYAWKAAGDAGHPIRNRPPAARNFRTLPDKGLVLPPRSITVLSW